MVAPVAATRIVWIGFTKVDQVRDKIGLPQLTSSTPLDNPLGSELGLVSMAMASAEGRGVPGLV